MDRSPARAAAERYIDAINRRDCNALIGGFASTATLHHPTGMYRGHAEIRNFYEGLVFRAETTVTVKRLLATGDVAIAEITGSSPFSPAPVQLVDVFEVDAEGKIVELAIYAR